ncbi:MAG TPA: PAS domain-containing protein [Gemmatimonadaceae bacterium]|nr:PAS domain-containing protein [Gemmatimonadaceae bacterium]
MSLRQRLGVGRGNWHRIYYLLALFDVLTVAGGLFLTHRLTDIFSDAVAVNQAWTRRLDAYSTLGTLASDVNAPGNDVFDTVAVDIEERRLAQALDSFNRATDAARREAENSLNGPARSLILSDLDAIAAENDWMVAEARRIFEYFPAGQPALAGRRMATMDRRYAELNAGLAKLRRDAIATASAALDQQEQAAEALSAYEIVIAIAILLMVAAATTYGHTISRRIKADATEREGLIAGLQQSEQRFTYAARATNDALWDWDLPTNAVWWNEGFRTVFGHANAVPTLEFWISLIHPEDGERVGASIHAFLETTSEVWTGEYRFKRADGSYAWVLDRGSRSATARDTPRT